MEIKIYKSKKELQVWENNQITKTYPVAVGKDENGTKEREGDMKTPEGHYQVCLKNPQSTYFLSFAINYPNNEDAKRGLASKLITEKEYQAICAANDNQQIPPQNTALGCDIYVHGELEKQNWSHGCVRLYNKDIAELYEKVTIGTQVSIYP
jgi:murein L,D-transpeptidase YafK